MSSYSDRWKPYSVDYSKMPKRRPGETQARSQGDFMRFLGAMAPAAGSVVGGIAGAALGGIPTGGVGAIPGAGVGASIGGGIGSMLGAGLGYGADEKTKDYDQDEMERRARAEALRSWLGRL